MMPNIVPLTSPASAMAADAISRWPRPQLPVAASGRPATIFLTRMQAGQHEAEALVAILGYLCPETPLLVLCGGGASPSFKAQPEASRVRFQVTEEALDAELVDLRLKRPREHMIAVFDPNRNSAAINIISMLGDFGVCVDLFYVAHRTETRTTFADRCRERGLDPIIAEEPSAFGGSDPARIQIPAIPRQLQERFQAGEAPFAELLDTATPGARAVYMKSAANFQLQLKDRFHG